MSRMLILRPTVSLLATLAVLCSCSEPDQSSGRYSAASWQHKAVADETKASEIAGGFSSDERSLYHQGLQHAYNAHQNIGSFTIAQIVREEKRREESRLNATKLSEYRAPIRAQWNLLTKAFIAANKEDAAARLALQSGRTVDASSLLSSAASLMSHVSISDESQICPNLPGETCHKLTLAAETRSEAFEKLGHALDNDFGPPSLLAAARDDVASSNEYYSDAYQEVKADYIKHGGRASELATF